MCHLCFPIVIWGAAPRHQISAVHVTTTETRLLTGGVRGAICLWAISPDSRSVSLLSLLTAHQAAVTAFCSCVHEWSEAVVSACQDGTLCAWDPQDGRCLVTSTSMLPYSPTVLSSLPNRRHFAVSGQCQTIDIVDSWTMKIIRVLRGHGDWVTGLYAFDVGSSQVPNPMLVSAARDGTVRQWLLNTAEDEALQRTLLVSDTVESSDMKCAVSPDTTMMLVVAESKWVLYSAGSFQVVLKVDAPQGTRWSDGWFINDTTVLISTTTGDCRLYTIPDFMSLLPVSAMDMGQDLKGTEAGEHYRGTSFAIPAPPKLSAQRDKSAVKTICELIESPMSLFSTPVGCAAPLFVTARGRTIARCSGDRVSVWRIPEAEIPAQLPVAANSSVAEAFPLLSGLSALVTANMVIADVTVPLMQVTGDADGFVYIRTLPVDNSPRRFRAHDKAVTCLMWGGAKRSNLLLTGSEDCTIRVWDINTGKHLHTLYEHTGTVLSLTMAPGDAGDVRGIFCSVGRDDAVVLYTLRKYDCLAVLGGHSAAITQTLWHPSAEYIVVACDDGAAYVWLINNGMLDARLVGPDATRLIETMRSGSHATARSSDGPAVDSVCVKLGHDQPPVQLLMFHMKRMAKQIDEQQLPLHYPLAALMYLYEWGQRESVDAMASQLGLSKPSVTPCYGIVGGYHCDAPAFSLSVPVAPVERWRRSPFMTFQHMLSAASICRAQMNANLQAQDFYNHMVIFFLTMLPDLVPGFIEPSLTMLVRYWQDSVEDIQAASRAMFKAQIGRLSPQEQTELVQLWTQRLPEKIVDREDGGPSLLAMLVLGVLAIDHPDGINEDAARRTTLELLRVLSIGGARSAAAGEILGSAFKKWQRHIRDVPAFLRRMLLLVGDGSQTHMKSFAPRAVVLMGKSDPKLVLSCISQEVLNKDYCISALVSFAELCDKTPLSLAPLLPTCVEIVMKCLEPSIFTQADMHVHNVIKTLVAKYPMISVSPDRDKLAFASGRHILVYELKAGAKPSVIDGHTDTIAAVAFAPNGKTLASYSFADATCRIWYVRCHFVVVVVVCKC
eukprot:TRINITY_DN4379_c0_g1_i1.p1 TRINITY_DN4379_c0_g1~~TRINITY_DN4379_c0_g1_i1.p1  ORF type:complete len:1060 (-),score=202.67 TRINITY_DN4379_c0_g1_i1:4110-7289(-)